MDAFLGCHLAGLLVQSWMESAHAACGSMQTMQTAAEVTADTAAGHRRPV